MRAEGIGDAPTGSAAAGWRGVAEAIHAARQRTDPVLLTVVPADCEPFWIDFGSGRYYWERPLTSMPEEIGAVSVHMQPLEPETPPYPWVEWRTTDPLLWQIARFAFGTDTAPWLRPGARFALQRWPNLTEIPHDAEEIRVIAMLANGRLSAEELGFLTGGDAAAAQRILNMLTLMGAAKAVVDEPAALPASVAPREAPDGDGAGGFGFFSRLRERISGRP